MDWGTYAWKRRKSYRNNLTCWQEIYYMDLFHRTSLRCTSRENLIFRTNNISWEISSAVFNVIYSKEEMARVSHTANCSSSSIFLYGTRPIISGCEWTLVLGTAYLLLPCVYVSSWKRRIDDVTESAGLLLQQIDVISKVTMTPRMDGVVHDHVLPHIERTSMYLAHGQYKYAAPWGRTQAGYKHSRKCAERPWKLACLDVDTSTPNYWQIVNSL